MAVAVTSDQSNRQFLGARVVVRTSAGIPYVIVEDLTNGAIRVFKGDAATPTSFAEQDSANNPATAGYGACSAAIDSTGIIHIAYQYDNGKASELRYVTFNTGTDAFAGDAQVIADIGADPTAITNLYTAIAIDSNDIPHIAYIEYRASGGTDYFTVFYQNRIGGAWNASGVEVEGVTANVQTAVPDIAIDADNKPVIAYRIPSADQAYAKAAIGNANDATSFTLQAVITHANDSNNPDSASIVVDSDGNHYAAWFNGNGSIRNFVYKHNYGASWATWSDTSLTSQTAGIGEKVSLVANGTDIYIFIEDSGDNDIHYEKYTGTWSGAWTTLETGTYNTAKAKWARYVDRDSSGTDRGGAGGRLEIDYCFTDETATPDVLFNSLTLTAPTVTTWDSQDLIITS